MMRADRIGRLLVGWVSCAALALGLPAPAGAYQRDFQVYAPTIRSQTGSLSFACPSGKLLMGTGANITVSSGFGAGLALTRLGYLPPGVARTDIRALFTDPGGGLWHVSGQAFCSSYTDFPPTAATAGPYLKDPVFVEGGTTRGSLSRQSSTATCVTGRRVIGGGFLLSPNAPSSHLAVDRAVAVGTNRFGVTAHETQPTSRTWAVQAYAVCANTTDAFDGPIYAGTPLINRVTSTATSDGYRGGSAGCAPNFFLLGGSARVLGATPGAAAPPEVVLSSSWPHSGGRPDARGRMWVAIAVEEDPTSAAWRLETMAVCVPLVSPS